MARSRYGDGRERCRGWSVGAWHRSGGARASSWGRVGPVSIGAVVVAYRDPSKLAACLESIAYMTEAVVVNVTADRAVAAVCRAQNRPSIDVRDNVGFGAAVNIGSRSLAAEVDEVLVLNDDVQVIRGPSPSPGGVRVPLQRTSRAGQDAPLLHSLPTPARFLLEWVLGRATPGPHADGALRPGTGANGAAFAVERTILNVTPFPEEYFLYWEETAWFWRLADKGITARVDATMVVLRPPGKSERSEQKGRLLGQNLIRIAGERYGRAGRLGYRVLGVAWVLRCVLTDLRHPDRLSRLSYRWSTVSGVIRGPQAHEATR